MKLAICIGCGCDDEHACTGVGVLGDENCCWLEVDRKKGVGVCSSCPGELARWKKGDRTPSQRALLTAVIPYVNAVIINLADCHRNPRTKKIEPKGAADEVKDVRRWLRWAKAAVQQ